MFPGERLPPINSSGLHKNSSLGVLHSMWFLTKYEVLPDTFFSKLIKKLIKLIRYTEQVRWHYIHYLYYIWLYNRQPHCFTQEINTRHLQFTNTDLLTSEQQIIYPWRQIHIYYTKKWTKHFSTEQNMVSMLSYWKALCLSKDSFIFECNK